MWSNGRPRQRHNPGTDRDKFTERALRSFYVAAHDWGRISVADLAPRKMPARAKDSRRPSGPSLLRPVAHEPQGCAAMSTPARLTATRAFASAAW
jgi:hypothetical protein